MKIDKLPMNIYTIINGEREHHIIYNKYYPNSDKTNHIHHINMIKYDNDINNLISLKPNFHKWLHSNVNFYLRLARGGEINKKAIEFIYNKYLNKELSLGVGFKKTYNNLITNDSQFRSIINE